ncbi:PKD repeat protein [Methanocalculus alkaliphilus]|uniref:PKD domain-containing protein n=1 Tax=Methanocalculus alkaliphilus TaxID=768730 RepID=UPI0020A14F8C|nr:PKD domain-containing protein [Methanocalculus alkaliphilus]MCP1715002.1 PKD repeat protein [Methanocalculus alkaliphilus]
MTSLGFGGRSIDLIIVDTDADVLVFGKTIAGGGWIPDPSEVPVANFTANTTSGYPPLTVQFIDQSTGLPTAWSWSFGDGNISALQNPMHTFSSPGSFTVTLTASNPNGSSIKTKENFIIVINPVDPLPVANFVANATEGEIPLIIQFTDTSTGTPDAWDWDFGDGTTSVEQHPIHTYTTAGYYNVTLTVANAAGNDSITKTNFIHAKGFVDFVIDENVFVYGNVLSFSGNSVTGPGATVVITGGFTTADINQGAAVAVSTIYFDGDVNLLSGSAGLGSSTQPGNIYVNGNMNLNGGSRNIYGDVYVKGDASIRGVILHGTFYIDGNLILGETGVNDFIFSENTRLYYTGTLVHHFNEPYPPEVQYILDRCIQDSSVPGFDMPDQDIPSTKSADWYAARGYVSESPLISNMKIYAPSYTGAVSWWPNPPPYENVIIIAHSGDITITGDDNVIKGVFFAPNGRVTFNGAILEGVVIARDGFYVTSGGTQVTFKNLDQYIGDPNDYPF